MYLARKRSGSYCLRESLNRDGRLTFRELHDLGEDPAAFIVYPGGNAFYFDQDLVAALADQGLTDADRELERALFPFFTPSVQRLVQQMMRLSSRKRVSLSREAMIRRQVRLHLFDRRRLYYLRYGRMAPDKTLLRPHRFLNTLIDMCRDEMECFFQVQEENLKPWERKMYLFQALDLGRRFPGQSGQGNPTLLDPEILDQAFLEEIRRLNQDRSYRDAYENDAADPDSLSDYLRAYVIVWFDAEFASRSPEYDDFREFRERRRTFKPPPTAADLGLLQACLIFELTPEQFQALGRGDLARIYRRLALARHPDQGGRNEDFVELNLAYEKLLERK
ncbi:MAG: hypothetical protein AB1641_21605 [Thermodesulfobacteriota bacterium]